jgi:hypothetical protein
LFFDKDYNNRDWSFSQLLGMMTDIDLVIHIFKVIRINSNRGDVFLNQVPFAQKLFEDYNQNMEFKLKNLALHRTEFNVSSISSATALTTLILSKVRMVDDISRFRILKYLVLDPVILPTDAKKYITIGLDDFPSTLEYLTLSNSVLVERRNIQKVYQFRIIFPDETLRNRQDEIPQNTDVLANLKTFCCDSCRLDSEIWTNLYKLFPNLTFVMLRTNEIVQLNPLLKIKSLKSVQLESSSAKNLSNFIGLEIKQIRKFPAVRLERQENDWNVIETSSEASERAQFTCNGGRYFWTSEEDYKSKIRLKSFEREAFNSNQFIFNGTSFASAQGRRKAKFGGIPPEIQNKLETIVLRDVEVTPRVLSDSIENCNNLRSLTLLNSTVFGNGRRYTFTTENLTFVLDSVQFPDVKFDYVYEIVNGNLEAGVIPYQHVGRANVSTAANTLSRLFLNVTSVRLQENSATLYIFDSTVEELRLLARHTRELITNLTNSHPLKPMLKHLKQIQMAYKDGILPPEWEFPGLQIIDQHLVEKFYKDSTAQIFGRLGVLRYLVRRYGKFLSLASLSLTALQNQTNTFPPVEAIALSLVRDRYLTRNN